MCEQTPNCVDPLILMCALVLVHKKHRERPGSLPVRSLFHYLLERTQQFPKTSNVSRHDISICSQNSLRSSSIVRISRICSASALLSKGRYKKKRSLVRAFIHGCCNADEMDVAIKWFANRKNSYFLMSIPIGYMEPPHYIQPSALVEILRNPDASSKRPVIIDVRDTDYAGGHIRSAVNIPEDNFMDDDDVDVLVHKYKEEDAIVFHCMMSQIRGPSCAKRFKARMEVVLENAVHKPRILILHGGYERFSSIYKNETDLIEMDD